MIPSVARMPRVALGHYPTPMTDAKTLSKALGGPRILIKRDDLSGLALGGNKCRHIEFLMGYVKEKGYDIVLCGGGSKPGNYGAQLIAAAHKACIKAKLYVRRDSIRKTEASGNALLYSLMDPDITFIGGDMVSEQRNDLASQVLNDAQRLEQEGFRPYVMQTIFMNETSVEQTGWVNAADEIYEQLKQMGVTANYLVIGNGQGGTQSGLIVGAKYLQAPFKVIGICIMFPRDRQIGELVRMTNETARFLDLDLEFTANEMVVYDDYMGEAYGVVSKECIEAIKLVAQTEGIFLDPVYTGKVMAGLIDLIRKGRITAEDTVVFVHTGGIPDIFSHGEELVGSQR